MPPILISHRRQDALAAEKNAPVNYEEPKVKYQNLYCHKNFL